MTAYRLCSPRPYGGKIVLGAGALMAAAGSAFAGSLQFRDFTSSRFPSPNPTEYTNQATIGDIDGDGDIDIIWASGGGFGGSSGTQHWFRIYINNGNATFADETVARGGNLPGNYRGAEMGDIDDDGDLDLILVQDYNKTPRLMINDGTGVFSNETVARLGSFTLSSSRAQFGDVDNDGDLDLYLTNGSSTNRFGCGQYRLYLNDGNGFFTDVTTTNVPQGVVCSNMDCIFGDIDGDFDIDIRTASTGTNNSRLYTNDGTGVFTQSNAIPNDSTCYSYDFGDMDGDGDLDLLGVNAGGGSTDLLLENDGDGTFSNVSSMISPNQSLDDNDSKFLDYDNDGDLDLVIGRIGGAERLYENSDGLGDYDLTNGVFQAITDSTLDIMTADFDSDGDFDVITAQGESGNFQNRFYINGGDPDTFAPRIHDTEQVKVPVGSKKIDDFVVRAAILDDMTSDRNFFDKGIVLKYSVDGGKETQVDMKHSGGQIYRGVIPGDVTGLVEYHVEATDWAGNTAVGPTLSFEIEGEDIPGDLNGDGLVDTIDLLALLGAWGACDKPCPPSCSGDLNGDCTVDTIDLLALLGNWS